jgi:hypothetical protein
VRSRSVVDGAESYIGLGRGRVSTFAIGHDLSAECQHRDDVCDEDNMHVDHQTTTWVFAVLTVRQRKSSILRLGRLDLYAFPIFYAHGSIAPFHPPLLPPRYL